MITATLKPAFAALLLFAAPHMAFAQEQPDETPAATPGDDAAQADESDDKAPAVLRTYQPINCAPINRSTMTRRSILKISGFSTCPMVSG